MSKKIIIIILLAIILLALGWFLITSKLGPQGSEESQGNNSFIRNLFPFGNSSISEEQRGPSPTNENEDGSFLASGNSSGLKLQQLTKTPVTGFVSTSSNSNLFIRYVEKATGNIYEIDTDDLSTKRLTNTLIPLTSEAVFHKDADIVALRSVNENDVIKTYVASITEASTTASDGLKKLEGEFILDNIKSISLDVTGTKFIYLKNEGLGSVTYTTLFDTENSNDLRMFDSPFAEWLIEYPNNDLVVATAKPSYHSEGYIYFVDTKTKKFKKTGIGLNGLTSKISSDGKYIMYSGYEDIAFLTFVANIEENYIDEVLFMTLPEKCVWSKTKTNIAYCGVPSKVIGANMPDDWYKGKLSFSDRIYELNVDNLNFSLLSTPTESVGTSIDLIDPQISVDGQFLLFKNKKDSTLWSLELPNIIDELFEDDEELDTEEVTEELPAS